MLTHPTLDQLHVLGLQGMAKAFTELDKYGDAASLSHAEWLALLLDRETTWRHDKRLSARLRYAKLRHQAAPEDVDYRSPRGLERRLFETLLVNVTGNIPGSGEVKFPTLRFSGSAVLVVGASVFGRSAAARRLGGNRPDGFGQEVGVATQAIAGAFDLNDDGVM